MIFRTPAPPPNPAPVETKYARCAACLVDRADTALVVARIVGVGLVPVCINPTICRLTGEATGVWGTIPAAVVAA